MSSCKPASLLLHSNNDAIHACSMAWQAQQAKCRGLATAAPALPSTAAAPASLLCVTPVLQQPAAHASVVCKTDRTSRNLLRHGAPCCCRCRRAAHTPASRANSRALAVPQPGGAWPSAPRPAAAHVRRHSTRSRPCHPSAWPSRPGRARRAGACRWRWARGPAR